MKGEVRVITQPGGDPTVVGGSYRCPIDGLPFRLLAVRAQIQATLTTILCVLQHSQRGSSGVAISDTVAPAVAVGPPYWLTFARGVSQVSAIGGGATFGRSSVPLAEMDCASNEQITLLLDDAVVGDTVSQIVWTVEML